MNDGPVALGDSGFATNENEPITINVSELLSNDSDVDGDNLTITSVQSAVAGTAAIVGTMIVFTPDTDATGAASFEYIISDGNGAEATASVEITILENIPPPSVVMPTNDDDILTGTSDVDVIDGLAGDDIIDGLSGNDTLIGGRGSDVLTGGAGNDVITTDEADGGNDRNDQDVIIFGDILPGSIGNDIITDFDTDNFRGGENNFDTLSFTFDGVEYELAEGRDIVNFVAAIESDGDTSTDAIRDGDDIIFVFARDEDGTITDSIRLEGVIGDDGITTERLNRASIDELSEEDVFATGDDNITDTSLDGAPIAVNDIRQTEEDRTITLAIFDLLANDFDIDNNSFQLTSIENVNGGSAELDGIGNVIFTPEPNYFGEASFSYTVRDLFGGEDQAVVTVNIASINDAPIPMQQNINIDTIEDTSFTYTLSDDFFSDIEGSAITVVATGFSGTALPEWIIFEGQTLSGTPPTNFSGDVLVELVASDGENETIVPVTVSITAVNERPVLTIPLPDRFIDEDEPFDIGIPLNAFDDVDGDILTYRATRPDGTILPSWIAFNEITGRIAGTPPQDFSGEVEVLITVTDGDLSTSNSFTLTVVGRNDAPTLASPLEDVTLVEDEFVQFTIPEATFFDIDGDDLELSAELSNGDPLPEGFSFVDGTFSGQPPENFTEDVQITVTASDGEETVSDSFTLSFENANDAPIIEADFSEISSGGSLILSSDTVLQNDFDPDGDELSLTGLGQAENGNARLDSDGDIIYTPDDGFFGVDSFEYTVTDGEFSEIGNIVVSVVDNFEAYDLFGSLGNDIIVGNQFSNNSINARSGNDTVLGGFFSDEINGGAGNDTLFGDFGSDNLAGGSGNDLILGGSGNDNISGNTGNDFILGGFGNDTFNFGQGDGRDAIFDFRGVNRSFTFGRDNITIDYDGVDDFNNLLSIASEVNGSSVFDFGDGDVLILNATRLASLDEDDFTFV